MSTSERVAQALLWSLNVQQSIEEDEASAIVEELLTGLMPVVDRLRTEAAAEELRSAADALGDHNEDIEVALGGSAYVRHFLRDRAAALRNGPTT